MKKLKNWRKNKMNDNLEITVSAVCGMLVGIFTGVFTAGNTDAILVSTLASFAVTFLAVQTFKEDN